MKKCKNILLINAHTSNKGDLAIINAITDSLLEDLIDVNISISILSCEYLPALEGIKIVPSIPNMKNSKFKILLTVLLLTLSKYSKIFLKFISEKEKTIMIEYMDSDYIISVGGHHFTDIIGRYIFLIQWYQLFLATTLNKPTVIYSQTIGPFKKSSYILRFLIKFLLKRIKLIMIREEKSLEFISNDLGISHPNLHLTADTAFLLKPKIDYEKFLLREKINKNKLTVGITVYNTPSYYLEKETILEEYKIFMAQICDYLIKNYNANIIFIPMEMDLADMFLIHNIVDMMAKKDKVTVLRNSYDAKETMAIIGHMDLMIATKTHSLIFSLARATPVFCIAYNYKSHEFMKSFGLDKYSFSINDLNYKIAKKCINNLIKERKNIKNQMETKSDEVQKKAARNIQLFKKIVYDV